MALRLLSASGSLFFRGCFSTPWAVEIPDSAYVATLLGADPEVDAVLLFHTVLRGAPRLFVEDPERPDLVPREGLALSPGDLVVLNGVAGHQLGEGDPCDRLAMKALMNPDKAPPVVLDYGPNDSTTMICGGFIFRDTTLDPMLESLPALMHVRADQASNNIATILNMVASETRSGGAGTNLFMERLSDLLLVEVLRNAARSVGTGWLAATADPTIGSVLAAMHDAPGRDWSLPVLARRAGVSRSGLSTRFRQLVGDTPGRYLTRLRMRHARQLLREDERSVAEVAELVGFQSVEGFSRTFKRVYGFPPSKVEAA